MIAGRHTALVLTPTKALATCLLMPALVASSCEALPALVASSHEASIGIWMGKVLSEPVSLTTALGKSKSVLKEGIGEDVKITMD